ncbi:MAG: acylneuraminate cytidylyltransferase family protein [Patescibacteria group bacterium]|jgi:N-acylneuraminate cytidylyltransferase/CMP-N,N'-diacetyllegionaminic acid synthase
MSPRVLVVIPARAGSKRIPNKNLRDFCGKPLVAHAVQQAKQLDFVDRVIVDTDSEQIAEIARSFGAEVPFLRPTELAQDTSQIIDSLRHLLTQLKASEGYEPTHLLLLQTTSPLREIEDIEACWTLMQESDATTVLTVCPTHPRLYHLNDEKDLVLGNSAVVSSTNVQDWKPGYVLNGCFAYVVQIEALLAENSVITQKTKAVVCPAWRSVDLDTPEDWVLAELLFTHRHEIEQALTNWKKNTV